MNDINRTPMIVIEKATLPSGVQRLYNVNNISNIQQEDLNKFIEQNLTDVLLSGDTTIVSVG
jgi:hypothetical protein